MTRPLILLSLSVMLCACNQSTPPPADTVESLVVNPTRLGELRKQCKMDRAKLGDAFCNVVAEATRRRFMGDGVTPYTPAQKE